MQLIVAVVLILCLKCATCKSECKRATFEGTTINVRLGKAEYHERRITGCITPFTVSTTVNFLNCYNHTIPAFYEGAISELPNVVNIQFGDNKIKRIRSRALTDLPQLVILLLDHNSINIIEKDAFLNMPKIWRLDLSYNKLAFLDFQIFGNLPSLELLGLSHNEIEAFEPEWFGDRGSSKLTTLSMDHNYIRTLPKRAFYTFKNLSTVDLTSNHIRSIHKDAFEDLHDLFILQLGNNRIQVFEDDVFKGLVNLNYVHFFSNNLTYISDKTLSDISKVQRVSIHGNPWQCGCYKRIYDWTRKHKIMVVTGPDACYDVNTPSCVIPFEEEDWCLEERLEDLNAIYFDYFAVNETCKKYAKAKAQ